ncbi:unnamed protein product [Ambrosiozyma monospora]|uniref:Unnamed protein product n=1 Tax=Ambrosiozyma monospora TaxID=43982 RepID=A0ACB5TJM3_AMBMO|nr:unnamed protein product [Ambrosiozyma monospora]
MKNASVLNGSNGGLSKLENMPMNVRKGMIKHKMERIAKYEKEAKEAGIVLAKTKKGEFRNIEDRGVTSFTDRIGTGLKKNRKIRDRGLKITSVGRSTRNGLIISKDEAAKMTSTPKFKGKKSGRRGRH